MPSVVGEAQGTVDRLIEQVMGPEKVPTAAEDWEESNGLSDERVVEIASTAKKFRRAWDGDYSDFGDDGSRGDAYVAYMLNWAGRDPYQTERIMRSNEKINRPKWDDHADYLLERTIMGAMPDEFYNPTDDARLHVGKRTPLLKQRVYIGRAIEQGIEPPDELIPDVVLVGRVHQVFAAAGTGKSWLALWLTKRAILRHKYVLYLDKENGQRIVAERLEALGVDPKMIDEYLIYVPFPTLDLNPDSINQYVEALDEIKPELIVFDSWINYLAAAGLDENSNVDVAKWSTEFTTAARERNIAVVLLDHVPKEGNGSRGASRKKDEVDVAWKLSNTIPFDRDREGEITLRREKDREGWLPFTVTFRIGGNPFVFQRSEEAEENVAVSYTHALEAIKEFGVEGARHGVWQRATEKYGTKRSRFNDAIKQLVADGLVTKVGPIYKFSPTGQSDFNQRSRSDTAVGQDRTSTSESGESGSRMGQSQSDGGDRTGSDPRASSSPTPVGGLVPHRVGLNAPDSMKRGLIDRIQPLQIIDDSGDQSPLASNPEFRAKCEFWPAFENPQLWDWVNYLWDRKLSDESKAEVADLLAENRKDWPSYAIHTPLQMFYVMARDRLKEAA
jgi:hypothetical protein